MIPQSHDNPEHLTRRQYHRPNLAIRYREISQIEHEWDYLGREKMIRPNRPTILKELVNALEETGKIYPLTSWEDWRRLWEDMVRLVFFPHKVNKYIEDVFIVIHQDFRNNNFQRSCEKWQLRPFVCFSSCKYFCYKYIILILCIFDKRMNYNETISQT